MSKAVAIISGGMDSVTLVYDLIAQGKEVHALSFFYKQRHAKELERAEKVCSLLNIPWQKVDLSDVNKLMKGSALSNPEVEVPKGHYAEDSMKATVVPSRNTIMLSIASAYAVSNGIDEVYFGAHAGDHAQYPDCRQNYLDALNSAFELANFSPVKVFAPYLTLDKGDIAKKGLELNVPYEHTWTCYVADERPCLECGSCVERTEAFMKAGSADPLLTSEEWIKAVGLYNTHKAAYFAAQPA